MITILTGPVGGGKTRFLKSAIDLLRSRGISPDGYLSERIMNGATVSGYDLADLRTGTRHPFLRRRDGDEGSGIGPYALNPDGLAAAEKIIGGSRAVEPLVLDELGYLELGGAGVWPAAAPVFADSLRVCLVVVRETLLDDFRTRWPAGIEISVVRLPASRDPEILVREMAKERE
ncbi:MAG: nucleoside-triphosphatase [Candidatus Aminicenantales bacterium]